MVWKMLVEEFQDGCLVHGHLWYVDRAILAILSLYSLYVLCGHLLGKGWPLGSRLWCLLWVCHFPIGILGQVWYLIVSIPDLCTITYFYIAWGIPPRFCSKEYMGWKRCSLKIKNLVVKFLAIFDFWMEWFYLFWVSMLHDAFHQVSAQENI